MVGLLSGSIVALTMVASVGVADHPPVDAIVDPDSCWVCEGEFDMGTGQWVPGTVGCDEALPGEEGRVNCMDDMLGTRCDIEEYEMCDEVAHEQELLAYLPGGMQLPVAHVQAVTRRVCATGDTEYVSVAVSGLY